MTIRQIHFSRVSFSRVFACLVPLLIAGAYGAQPALGQNRGLFGQRNVGSTLQPGQRTFGGSGLGAGGGIGSGVGTGIGAGGQGAANQANANAGQLTGSERFVRGNRQPGQFVGSDAGDVQSPRSVTQGQGGFTQTGPSGAGNFGPGSIGANGANRAGAGGNVNRSTGNVQPRVVRTTYRVAFEYPQPASSAAERRVQEALQRQFGARQLSGVSITVRDGVAALRGTVATDHDRRVARILASLEPGVERVENRLTLRSSSTSATPPPASGAVPPFEIPPVP